VNAEVIASFGRHLLLRDAAGQVHKARPMGRSLDIVCGDLVECAGGDGTEVLAQTVLPRRTQLRRSSLRGRSETLAANLTQLGVVLAPVPEPDLFMVDRYICAAECAGLHTLIILNKDDLPVPPELAAGLAQYASLGYRVLAVSTHVNPQLPAALAEVLRGETTVLAGQSGVGKSSLTRLLTADAAPIAIGELLRDEEGRHTTTASRLYECSMGGRVIDSPGVRDFAPAIDDLEPSTLGFREISQLAAGCRFQDCRHLQEPKCAIRDAVAAGTVDARRYESYRRLRRLHEQLWEQRPPGARGRR
jgi:ribosome biogenesis GTPase / thiamine phosphate phosphatase